MTIGSRRSAAGGADQIRQPEIVIGLVSPIATDTDAVCSVLREALRQVASYKTEMIRISELIDTLPGRDGRAAPNRFERLMDKGDYLREQTQDGSFCAMLAVQAIRAKRAESTGDPMVARPDGGAVILVSLKHPAEARLLRRVYGRRMLIIGVSEDIRVREERLRGKLLGRKRSAAQQAKAASEARALILRDEKDELHPLGQSVRDTYALCDAYLPASGGQLTQSVRRLVDLMFGQPFITPTRDEMGAWFAYAAKLRSSAAGRQVGAALLDDQGELLAEGCNDVPAAGGGQPWEGDLDDHRDFAELRHDANESKKFDLTCEMLAELRDADWLSDDMANRDPEELAALALDAAGASPLGEELPPLERTRVSDLLEFGRVMHAEMAILMTAARRGTPVRKSSLYTTTYPCHECMRLIIGAGIARIVYIDPYPKSLVPELFGSHLRGKSAVGQVVDLDRFVGIAPRLMPEGFSQVERRKTDIRGRYYWLNGNLPLTYLGADETAAVTIALQELLVGAKLSSYLPNIDEAAKVGNVRRLRSPGESSTAGGEGTADPIFGPGWLQEQINQCRGTLSQLPSTLGGTLSQVPASPQKTGSAASHRKGTRNPQPSS
jgi:deoxycytidylate deaminase